MADIRHGLKESGQINDEEERLFKAMNYRQDYLGGLNLHVLEGRLVQLLPGLDDIWHEEDPEKAGQVFLRLLEFYWRIAEKRREVDREFKARERLKKTLGFMPGVVPLEEPSEETSDHSDSENDSPRHWKAKRSKDQELETEEEKLIPMILQELAEDLRGHLQGKCGICPGEVMVEEVGEKVKFLLQCPVCLASKLIEAPLSDLQRKFRDLEQ